MDTPRKRFSVALSFPGKHREFVERVASHLARELGRQRVLYDAFHEAEFAQVDLDTHLQELYHDESELIAVFLSVAYKDNEWCGLEWRALRDVIKGRYASAVMPLRFDDTAIPGLFSIDGYVWIGDRGPEDMAALILKRLPFARSAMAALQLEEDNLAPAPGPYHPPLVLSVRVHGTEAPWLQSLAETLGQQPTPHRTIEVGGLDWFRYARESSRQRAIDEFYESYGDEVRQTRDIDLNDYRRRPSIVAHGLASYVVGKAMQKYDDIRFDKVVLCGSILPVDFDWSTLFHRDQVGFVLNEMSERAFASPLLRRAVPDAGASGSAGFESLSTVVSQERFESFSDRDFFRPPHIESHWLPVLRREPSSLQIRHGRNMYEDQARFVATLDATAAIDNLCFGHIPEYVASQIPRGLSTEWIEKNPDIYTFLFDRRTGKVRGYINAMPVTDECFAKIKAGQIRDNEITGKDVVSFFRKQTLNLYLMSVATHPGLRRANQGLFQEPFERLVNAFFSKLLYYAVNNQIRVAELVAVGWTEPGESLCKAFGMRPLGVDPDKHPVYGLDFAAGSLTAAKTFTPRIQKLSEVYRRLAADQG